MPQLLTLQVVGESSFTVRLFPLTVKRGVVETHLPAVTRALGVGLARVLAIHNAARVAVGGLAEVTCLEMGKAYPAVDMQRGQSAGSNRSHNVTHMNVLV